jgi:ParB-like nuclease domain
MNTISIDEVKETYEAQARAAICEKTVAEYADLMSEGIIFPPVIVFADGIEYTIADGHHRYLAAKKIGAKKIEVIIEPGSVRDAILFSVGANSKHGLRLTLADRRKAVTILLQDEEWTTWSNAKIAEKCCCSVELVARMRQDIGAEKISTACTRNGKRMLMRTPRHVRSQEDVYPSENGGIEESPPDPKDIELETALDACRTTIAENELLRDQLIKVRLVGDKADREAAALEVDEMRRQIKLLEVEVRALANSRDQFQNENVQLMKQVNYLERQRKKCTCRLTVA